MNQIEGSTCIITGANSGIGRAAATEIARMGARVVMVCRNRQRGREALLEVMQKSGSSEVDLLIADLSVQSEIRELATKIAADYPQVDVLLNNAGLFRTKRETSPDGLEMTFAVNHLGYFLLTLGLLDTLKASSPSRIVNVASGAHRGAELDFDDLQLNQRYSGWKAYKRSKLANLLFTFELARRLDGTGVTVNALHPGVVSTGFGRAGNGLFSFAFSLGSPFMRTSEQGAQTSVHLATSPDVDGISGKYFVNERIAKSSRASLDQDAAARLWSESLKLAGLENDPLPVG